MAIFTAIGTAFAAAIGGGAFLAATTACAIGSYYCEEPNE